MTRAPRPLFRNLALWIAPMVLSSCGSPSGVDDADRPAVLTAFLFRGEPVREVYLQRLAPIEGFYDPASTPSPTRP